MPCSDDKDKIGTTKQGWTLAIDHVKTSLKSQLKIVVKKWRHFKQNMCVGELRNKNDPGNQKHFKQPN